MTGPGQGRGAAIEAADVVAGVVIDLAGLALGLAASDLARGEAVASLFRHAERCDAAPDAHLRCDAAPVELPDGRPSTSTPLVDLWAADPDRLTIRSRAGIAATADASQLHVGGDAPALAREVRLVALMGLTHLLARHDRHLLHGAAVRFERGALVIVGPTGTGKSTLALAALRRGIPVLSDDTVVVRRTEAGVVVQGLPRPIAVAADVLDAPAAGRRVPEDYRDRTELAPGTLATGAHPVVGLAVTTGVAAGGPALDGIAALDTLRSVLRSSVSLVDRRARPELFALAGDLARLPAWSLTHGPDPASALVDATVQLERLGRLLAADS